MQHEIRGPMRVAETSPIDVAEAAYDLAVRGLALPNSGGDQPGD